MWQFLQYKSCPSQKVKNSNKKFKKKSQKSQKKPDFWSFLKPAALWRLLGQYQDYFLKLIDLTFFQMNVGSHF
jgi:hypothetical protein